MTVFIRHPVDNPRITYGFGAGGDKWGANKHLGVDYGGYEGQPIYAPASGVVEKASSEASGYGNTHEQIPGSTNNGNHVILRHDAPHQATNTLYAHLSGIAVSEGQRVTAGQVIGYMGNTGYSFGTHLHWEMFIDYAEGSYPAGTFYGRVDPLDYFQTVTVVPVAPGAGGGSAAGAPSNPKPIQKEWHEMPIPAEDLKKIHDAIWHGVPGAKLINNRETKKGEWAETTLGSLTDRIVRQQIAPMRQEVAASNAQIKGLVGAIAALSKGEPFDEAKLLAGVQAAAKEGAREGVAETIDSIDVTVNTKGEAA